MSSNDWWNIIWLRREWVNIRARRRDGSTFEHNEPSLDFSPIAPRPRSLASTLGCFASPDCMACYQVLCALRYDYTMYVYTYQRPICVPLWPRLSRRLGVFPRTPPVDSTHMCVSIVQFTVVTIVSACFSFVTPFSVACLDMQNCSKNKSAARIWDIKIFLCCWQTAIGLLSVM